MQFNQISYFLRTCDTLNFTQAAVLCNVSQPSLSASIKKLEEELGGLLFERNGHSISLTSLGESMRIHLSQIEQARRVAKTAAASLVKGQHSIVNVGLMCTLSSMELLPAIESCRQGSPNIELLVHDVWESKSLDLLLAGAIDCLVMAHKGELSHRFDSSFLTTEKMLLAMNDTHPLSGNTNVSIKELKGYPYIDRLKCEFRDLFYQELSAQNVDVQVVLRSEREDLVTESVVYGIGVTILPESVALGAGLKTCEINELPLSRKISIVTVKNRILDPAVNQVVKNIQEAYL